MKTLQEQYGLGWMRDLPDVRDYWPEHETIKPMLKKLKTLSAPPHYRS